MEGMLSAKPPFHKAGPQMFLDKIPAEEWRDSITRHFRKLGRTLDDPGLETPLASADLIPYDVQRIAHELWDCAELKDKRKLDVSDVKSVIESLVTSQSTYYDMSFSGNNFRLGNAPLYRRSLTAGPPKSTPRSPAKSFVSDQRLLFRKLSSRLIREISWIDTKVTTSSWTRSFPAGLEKRAPST
jgi:hypothetical protein